MAHRRPTGATPPERTRRTARPGSDDGPPTFGSAREDQTGANAVPALSDEDRALTGRRPFALGALLLLLVAGLFLPAVRHDFITYDDMAYVITNRHVTGGLTWENLQWAWQSSEHSNWHPLTWMSHMLDCQLFGLRPWGHHLTSVLLHAVNTLLLFVVLRQATKTVWRSFFVAALFGLHPLHVESVAWVAERKDVLSTFFEMLTLWAYVHWGDRTTPPRRGPFVFYGLALVALAAGLTAKPMLVTVPGVLLLLDFWPLNRWAGASSSQRGWLLVEKLPFFALAAASSAVTYRVQQHGGAVQAIMDFSLPQRLTNALVAYCQYLGKCFLPVRLAVLYPNFGELPPWWQTLLAGGLLAGVTAAVFAWRRSRPQLVVGWLWFLGTLVPVIGLVQVGGQTMADRYSYVPLIGIFLAATWTLADARWCRPHWRTVLAVAVLVCGGLTSRQLGFWRDSETLFRHALAVTENNWMAHFNLSAAYDQLSRPAEAKAEFDQTIGIIAAVAERHDQRGQELARIPGRLPEAIAEFEKALRIKGDNAVAHNHLGLALQQTPGRLSDAIAAFRAAVKYQPDFPEAHCNLGRALARLPDHPAEALTELRLAAWLKPDWPEARCALGAALASDPGRRSAAIFEYEAALRLAPGHCGAHLELGRLLAEIPARKAEAIGHVESALRGQPDSPDARALLDRLRAAGR